MSTALSTVDLTQLPSTQMAGNFDDLAKGGGFLGRIQLYTKGEAIDAGHIGPGRWGIPKAEDDIFDLGTTIDVLVFARRPKAMDFSDKGAIITSYDDTCAEFARIRAKADNETNSKCMYGVSFLVFERSTGDMYELFFGAKSSRREAKVVYPFLPPRDEAGKIVGPPEPMTLKIKHVKGKYSFHVPVAGKCSTPFTNVPPTARIAKEMDRFLNPKTEEVEVVEKPAETAGKKGRAR